VSVGVKVATGQVALSGTHWAGRRSRKRWCIRSAGCGCGCRII